MSVRLPLWMLTPIYTDPNLTLKLIEAVRSNDTGTLDAIVQEVATTANRELCSRELNHTINNQFSSARESLRELLQNSLDAYTDSITEVDVTYRGIQNNGKIIYYFSWTDRGRGMTIDEMITYLLVIGSTSKADDKTKAGKHGQGMYPTFKASRTEVFSHGWRTTIARDQAGEYYVEFDKSDLNGQGTTINVSGFCMEGQDFESYFREIASFINPKNAVVRLDSAQVNSRKDFDLTLTETVKIEGKEYPIQIHLSAGHSVCHYTQSPGLPIINRGYHDESPEILVEIPPELVLSRERRTVPEIIEEHISARLKKYRREYASYLLHHLDELKPRHIFWLEDNLQFSKTIYLLYNAAGATTFLGVWKGFGLLGDLTSRISPIISKGFEYGSYAFMAIVGGTLATTLGYAVLNQIKNRRKDGSDEEEPIKGKKFSIRKYLNSLSDLLLSFLPRYNFKNKEVIPAQIKKRESILERKVSINQIEWARKRKRLYFGQVREADGIYLGSLYQSRYGYREKVKNHVGLADIVYGVSSFFAVFAHIPYYIPIPHTLTRLIHLGNNRVKGIEEAGSYLSSLISEANRLQDVGVHIGYSNKSIKAWTPKLRWLAPAYVAINRRDPLVQELEEKVDNGWNDSEINALANLLGHEYAHHKKKIGSDLLHDETFEIAYDRVMTNFYNLIAQRGIDLKKEINAILQRYASQKY